MTCRFNGCGATIDPNGAASIACTECAAKLAEKYPDGKGGIDYRRLWLEKGDIEKLPERLRPLAQAITEGIRESLNAAESN